LRKKFHNDWLTTTLIAHHRSSLPGWPAII
jgi:hypothetical protein